MIKAAAEKVGLVNQYSSMELRVKNAAQIDYSLRTYVLLFFVYSMVGWLWELGLFAVVEQDLVNTGLLHGPWLPIYGVGGVAALELFKNIRTSPGKTFVSIMVVAGVLEYATHFATEKIFGVTWWDYSEFLLSINDRICIEGLLAFGALGCLAIYIISPKVQNLIRKIDIKYQNYIIYILGALFIIDMIYSFINPNYQNTY